MAMSAQTLPNGLIRLPSGITVDPKNVPQIFNDVYVARDLHGGKPLSSEDMAALQGWTSQNYTPQQQAALYGAQTLSENGGAVGNQFQQNTLNNALTANQGIFDNLAGWQKGAFNSQNELSQQNLGLAGQSMSAADQFAQLAAGLGGASWNSASTANAGNTQALGNFGGALGAATQFDLSNLGGLNSALGSANAFDQQNLGGLYGAFGNTGILQAGGYGAPVVSQAQYAQADPASIAAQNQALAQLQGAANGSLNNVSQAAQAYADAGDVANQRNAADALQGIANGSKDVDFYNLPGISDLYDVSKGSKDVHVGQEDPAAYASEQQALQHLTDLSNPEVTAQERFIYEQARQQQEQDERNNRAAVMTNLRQRGMSGSGMEIGQEALAGQQTSQNRLLSDLGAQSTAVQRAMAALNGQASLSSAMTAQGNQVAEQNAATQLAALGQYTGLGASVATSNMDRQTQAQAMASQAYATLRAQGFSEEYARGQAADIMANANSDRQLNAMNMSGNLASTQRSQSFNEDFQTKSAADQMAQFNKEQSQISQRWQEQYAAGQQTDYWNRVTDVFDAGNKVSQNYTTNAKTSFDAGNTVSQNYATNAGNFFTGAVNVNNSNNQNTQSAIGTIGNLGYQSTGLKQNALNTGINANWTVSDTYAKQLAAMTQLGMGNASNNLQGAGLQNQLTQTQMGNAAGAAAAAEAKKQADNSFNFLKPDTWI